MAAKRRDTTSVLVDHYKGRVAALEDLVSVYLDYVSSAMAREDKLRARIAELEDELRAVQPRPSL